MTKRKLIVYGAGGHGKVIVDAAETQGMYEIVGYLDDTQTGEVCGYPVLGPQTHMQTLDTTNLYGIVAIGNPVKRAEVTALLKQAGIALATIIHSTAYIAKGATLGEGTVVLPNAVIGADATVGKGCIINTGATVDHDCVLADYVHIAPGAHLAGSIHIEEHSHIGIGCSIKEGIRIGANCMIGAGSVVIDAIPANTVAYGVPATPADHT